MKQKISARKFENLLERNNSYEAAFLYTTMSQTQITEGTISDDYVRDMAQKAKDGTYYDITLCPANQDKDADEMNDNLRHPFDLFETGVVVSFWDCSDQNQTYTKILLVNA